MNGPQNNSLLKVSISVLLFTYFMLGNVMLGSGFSWSPQFNIATFGQRPAELTRYELKFTHINGERLDQPIYFSDMDGMLGNDDIYEGKRIINRLGHAVFEDDKFAIRQYHAELETVYLWTLDSAEYEIIFIDTDPVEKYSLGAFRSERVVLGLTYPLGEPIALAQ